jgi:cytochrome subunit of sulfide dehydrogenase
LPPIDAAQEPRHVQEEHVVRLSKSIAAALLALALAAAVAAAQAPDPDLARNLAATCTNCHGTNGVSQGGTESLAGMPKDALVRTMQEFKSGSRPATIMHQLAKGYTDEQIALVAGWFAAQKVPR